MHVILIVIGYHLPTYSCTYTHRYFPVCNGGLVPDIMHDVLEGALEYEVKLMLAHMISEEKYFTFNQFNSRLENMELGYMEAKDRSTLIANTTLFSASNKLKQEGILLSYMHMHLYHSLDVWLSLNQQLLRCGYWGVCFH